MTPNDTTTASWTNSHSFFHKYYDDNSTRDYANNVDNYTRDYANNVYENKKDDDSKKQPPFWLKFVEKPPFFYLPVVQKQIFRMMLMGAYSRKYDKPRRKKKKRIL
jgi:hypothetical protein